jgi:hypothetical protein
MNLNLTNRLVRTRMLGGVAGAQSIMAAPYADWAPDWDLWQRPVKVVSNPGCLKTS